MNYPRLIDTNTSAYLQDLLKKCHDVRVETYSYFMNVGIIFAFVIIACIILYYSFRTKKTPEEKQIQHVKDQKYILDKIKELQIQRKLQQEFITNLPH